MHLYRRVTVVEKRIAGATAFELLVVSVTRPSSSPSRICRFRGARKRIFSVRTTSLAARKNTKRTASSRKSIVRASNVTIQ